MPNSTPTHSSPDSTATASTNAHAKSTESTLFVDNLTVIDFSYLCPTRGIVGESWIVDLQLTGQLDQQGMIFDFGNVKKQVKWVIDALFDHKLLIPTECPAFQLSALETTAATEQSNNGSDESEQTLDLSANKPERHGPLQFEFTFSANNDRSNNSHTSHSHSNNGEEVFRLVHRSPREAVCLLPIEAVNIDTVLPFIKTQINAAVPENVVDIKLSLRTEESDQPYYQYSHGLQFHDGDCQRIAHGHRSRLNIHIDDQRQSEEERQWCQKWQTIYIATDNHIKNREVLNGIAYLTMAYEAEQGFFQITLPECLVHVIETETTVELIASHIAQTLAEKYPGKKIIVKAYEGVNKGAIAEKTLVKQ